MAACTHVLARRLLSGGASAAASLAAARLDAPTKLAQPLLRLHAPSQADFDAHLAAGTPCIITGAPHGEAVLRRHAAR